MTSNSPKLEPSAREPEALEAHFEEVQATGHTPSDATSAPPQNLVLVPQTPSERINALITILEQYGVPQPIQNEWISMAMATEATAHRVLELESRLEAMQAVQQTRDSALAAFLLGGKLPEGIPGEPQKGVEKAPDKLRPLSIETPDSAELAREHFSITLENPNGEEVRAEVVIALEDFNDKADPVLEAVVNPTENRSGHWTARPVILGPNEKREIQVALRSKLGKEGNPKPEDIIAEQLRIDVTLKPTDIDSALGERTFPPVKRDVRINEVLEYQNTASVMPYAESRSGKYSFSIPLAIDGIKLKSPADQTWKDKMPLQEAGMIAYYSLNMNVRFALNPDTQQYDMQTREIKADARTAKGFIPITLKGNLRVKLTTETTSNYSEWEGIVKFEK